MKITKETLKRALRTFVQAFISYIIVNYAVVDMSGDKATIQQAVIGLVMSAVAAGFSALMNLEKKEGNE